MEKIELPSKNSSTISATQDNTRNLSRSSIPADKSSYRRHGIGWLLVFLLFYALPIGIFYEGYRIYLQSTFTDSSEKLIQYYTRELTSIRNHVSNERVLLQIFNNFRDNFKLNPKKPDRMQLLVNNLRSELPPNSSVIIWDADKNRNFNEGISENNATEAKALIKILSEGCTQFGEGANPQTGQEFETFSRNNRDLFAQLEPTFGSNFPYVSTILSPGTLVRGEDPKHRILFFWDFLGVASSSLGGFAGIVHLEQIKETYGFSHLLSDDRSANPEFTYGFLNMEDQNLLKISFRPLEGIAKQLLTDYRQALKSPISNNDWIMIVVPLSESSAVRLFSLFSIRKLRTDYENNDFTGAVVAFILLLIGCISFYKAFQKSLIEGISIKVKIAGLFFLSMFLPISMLCLLGLHYSLDRAKVLAGNANQLLMKELKRLDDGAGEFYRAKMAWLRSLKNLPEMKIFNAQIFSQYFKGMFDKKFLQRIYLVDRSGNILFDQDHLFEEAGKKTFFAELGRRAMGVSTFEKAVENVGSMQKDILDIGLINRLAGQKGLFHHVNLPGALKKTTVFFDFACMYFPEKNATETTTIITVFDKNTLDQEYLTEAFRNQTRCDSYLKFFALSKENITDSIPALQPTFKANIIPMLNIVQIREFAEAEQIQDENEPILVALSQGRLLDGYYLGACIGWNTIIESIYWIYGFVLIALFLSITGSLFLVVLLSRGFLAPIGILSKGTRAIAAGDLNLTLPVGDRDELGDLSTAFNDMTKRLRNRITELTVLYNLTQKASTAHNQREVFELAAQNLKEHLGAQEAGIAWINEGEGLSNLYLVELREPIMAERIKKTIADALTERTLQLQNIKDTPGMVLGIPLFFEEKDFGGVYLIYKETFPHKEITKAFTLDERSFVETLRHHLSLIIEKQRLFEQAITDSLTRLYVRRFFLASLEKELARARRYKTELSLVLIDIDHFKKFNDKYGHQVGDLVLKETAQRIFESIRAVDTPGRYGGEELAIILPQTNLNDAVLVSERIRKAVASISYPSNEKSLNVTISIGVTSLSGRNPTLEEFIEESDKAMYKAKEGGRNQVAVAKVADFRLET